ncbi:MAG TPA: hypothetical protein VIA06_24905 [Candidatus Dormibacteraeota bacterium]|jgi:hypothetical protein|nr:hypothetical protein [Candidatus Dormibacteraeota bacterium]
MFRPQLQFENEGDRVSCEAELSARCAMGFELFEDTALGDGKRWVVVRPVRDASGRDLCKSGNRPLSAVGGQELESLGAILRGRPV